MDKLEILPRQLGEDIQRAFHWKTKKMTTVYSSNKLMNTAVCIDYLEDYTEWDNPEILQGALQWRKCWYSELCFMRHIGLYDLKQRGIYELDIVKQDANIYGIVIYEAPKYILVGPFGYITQDINAKSALVLNNCLQTDFSAFTIQEMKKDNAHKLSKKENTNLRDAIEKVRHTYGPVI